MNIQLPPAPRGIQKGIPLKTVLDAAAVRQLALNISYGSPQFPVGEFEELATDGLADLELMPRAHHIAKALRVTLPAEFSLGAEALTKSLMPLSELKSEEIGIGLFFYLPYSAYLGEYGLRREDNGGEDPFPSAMQGMYELTKRFTSEFAIRNYLLLEPERTLAQLRGWIGDTNKDVRRLVTEGTRPLLPWGKRLPDFLNDPTITLPLLEKLKDDSERYVTRSVANHLGDLAKKHPVSIHRLCHKWLDEGTSEEVKWLIRHAVRYHAKREHPEALLIRKRAK